MLSLRCPRSAPFGDPDDVGEPLSELTRNLKNAMNAIRTVNQEEVEQWFEEEDSEYSPGGVQGLDVAEKYARSQLRVVRETKDYQLDYLRHALQPGKELIDTSPGYQRRLRWPNKKRSLLIESFLLNIPVPPVFLFEHDYNAYEVIDGRQRIETIRSFLANNFALSSLEYWPELNRKRFNDLPLVLQKGLLRRSLPAVVLLAETRGVGTDDIDVRRVLFDRLNTGGIRLNPQELRNALYPGALNAMLIRLARSTPFTTTWGIPPYSNNEEQEPAEELLKNPLFASLADAELVLRFFALRDAIENDGAGSLRRIMDRYMETNKELGTLDERVLEDEFMGLLGRLVALFDGEPFRLPTTNRPSRPLYDALMIALSQHPGTNIEGRQVEIRGALAAALEDSKSYDVLVGRGNTLDAVRQRVALATQILQS
ncbi:DUF262 domain-containing protein [Burkholderia sp. R-69980]|nr:DUF262 domain-containing protein [Burkholderia sp. R-69980]